MTKLEVIENESTLNELHTDWTRLGAAATPMQSPQWMLAWWHAHQGLQDRLFVLALRDENNELIGLVPWYRHASVALGTTIRFLGSGKACSDYQTLLCRPGSEQSVVREVTQWLSRHHRANERGELSSVPRWDLLDLEGVSESDLVMNSFVNSMGEREHVTHRRPSESTWRIDLSGGWSGFLSRQSKTQRSQTRNFINRFDKSSNLSVRFASQELLQADSMVSAMMELHQMRWRAVGVEGCFADNRMKSFFEAAMREMLTCGSAEIVLLERSHRPVAAQAWLIQDGSVYLYQSGRDPAEDANRVGRIATSVALRWACEQGFQAVDFLRGDESYKSQMRAEPTLGHRVRIVARANFPELRHKLWLACREVKTRWQELRRPAKRDGAQVTAEENNSAAVS